MFVSESRTFAVAPEHAYEVFVAAPLEELFVRRVGPMPPVKGTAMREGTWGIVPASRTVRLADGGSMLETLTLASPPSSEPGDFRYEMTEIAGPMKPLVATIDGRFTFAADGAGTRITWSWDFHPRNRVTALLLRPIAPFWQAMARGMFDRLGDRLA